ncbi:MAG: hypothetical protein ABSF67_07300 [Roseiarcus sp.]
MKGLQLTMIAFMAIQSTAYAQSWRSAKALYETQSDRDQKSVVESSAPPFVAGMVRNPNACGADHAEPVWGSTLALLGYTCSHNENGG